MVVELLVDEDRELQTVGLRASMQLTGTILIRRNIYIVIFKLYLIISMFRVRIKSLLMFNTGFLLLLLIIIIQFSCTGMDCSHKLHTSSKCALYVTQMSTFLIPLQVGRLCLVEALTSQR